MPHLRLTAWLGQAGLFLSRGWLLLQISATQRNRPDMSAAQCSSGPSPSGFAPVWSAIRTLPDPEGATGANAKGM